MKSHKLLFDGLTEYVFIKIIVDASVFPFFLYAFRCSYDTPEHGDASPYSKLRFAYQMP